MDIVLKALVFTLFFLLTILAGLAIYRVINNKIIESEGQWKMAGLTLVLLLSLSFVFVGSLAIFIEVYRFLAQNQ